MSTAAPGMTSDSVRVPRRERPFVRTEVLILGVCTYFIAAYNLPLWRELLHGRSWQDLTTWGYVALTAIALIGAHFFVIASVTPRAMVKPLLIILSVVAAVAAVYMNRYYVVLDPSMLRNVWRTDWPEASELLTLHTLLFASILSLPPVAVTAWVRLERRPLVRALAIRAAALGLAVVAIGAASVLVMKDIAPLLRMQRHVRYLATPGNLIYSGARALFEGHGPEVPRTHERAVRLAQSGHTAPSRPQLVVVVVGETARSANFSLNGYARNTNPQLVARDVVSFQQVRSCGTATEVSLPCMFSPFGRREYDADRNRNRDGLLQVLAHAGFDVLWLDNQSGCKGVCDGDGIRVEHSKSWAQAAQCELGRCLDEVLLERFEKVAASARGDLVVVLHQLGNHGPAYYKRYPSTFRRFTPTCDTSELRNCDRTSIVNTYDNAILYTDALLARLMDLLRGQQARFDTAMLYVGDHGESLGEAGLYLHGLPYALAPTFQTEIPMIFWASAGFSQRVALDVGCVKRRSRLPASHDNFFHSVLGLTGVITQTYRRELDLFADCRLAQPNVAAGIAAR